MRYIAVIILLILTGIGGNTRIAHADPHAMFYTAIGQQQLFFNVLAALDQADYVETAVKREELRKARAEVTAEPKFARETESGGKLSKATEISQGTGKQTETCVSPGYWPSEGPQQGLTCQVGQTRTLPGTAGTPALLNRAVSLEGADLYTDQLVRMFGAESARRNSMSELLRTLCDFGLGIENCGFSLTGDLPKSPEQKINYRENAMVTEPLEWSLLPVWYGVEAALYSGEQTGVYKNPDPTKKNPANPSQTKQFLNEYEFRVGKWLKPDIFGAMPFAYSSQMEWIWAYIEFLASTGDIGDYMEAEAWYSQVSTIVESIIDKYLGYPSQVTDFPLEHISFIGDYRCVRKNQDGEKYLYRGGSLCADLPNDMTIERYIAWVADAQNNLYNFIDNIASNAASRIAAQQSAVEEGGLIAPIVLRSENLGFASPNWVWQLNADTPGELTAYLKSPKAARRAAVEAIPETLAALDASQQASALTGLDKPGNKQLVYRTTKMETCVSPGYWPSGSPNDPNNRCNVGETRPVPDSSPSPGTQASDVNPGTVAGLVAQAQSASPSPSPPPGTGSSLLGPITYDLFNPQKFPEYDKAKKPTSPSANLIAPHLEQGAAHALIQFTGGLFRKAGSVFCGMTCLWP